MKPSFPTADGAALPGAGGDADADAGASRPSRRNLLLGGAMVGTALITYGMLPRKRVGLRLGVSIEKFIPSSLAGWPAASGAEFVLPPADEEKAAEIYQDVLTRAYTNAGSMVMLLVAYDPEQTAMLHIHRPDTCYPSNGFKIEHRELLSLDAGPTHKISAKFLSARQLDRFEHVLYWGRIGNEFPTSFPQQRRSLFWQNMNGYVPDGALVRLSVVHPDGDSALAILKGFAQVLFAGVGPLGRELLLGPAIASDLAKPKA